MIGAQARRVIGTLAHVAGTPEEVARPVRRSAQALGALSLVSGLSGGAILVGEAAGLLTGAVPEAAWLIACGLVAAGLAGVAMGLSRSAARMQAPVTDMPDLLTTLHARSGETLAVERPSLVHDALQADALAGQGLFGRIHVMDRPAFLSAISACASGRRDRVVPLRLRCEHAGEAPVFSHFDAALSPVADGGVRILWRDAVPEAAEGEAARVEAERANDAKTRFLRAMSHELRTPLNSILGFSELLTEDVGQMDAARRSDYARIIHQSGQHLLGLVNGILDLSRVEAGAYELSCEDIEVKGLVSGCIEMMALEAERRGVRLTADLSHHLPLLSADQRAVRQILLNLLSNAVKFTPTGGAVDLSAGLQNGAIVFKVRDTGIGMCSADVGRLGEPFFQAGDVEQRRAGIGLGIAVVRALVDLHRGAFEVTSVLGVGTTAIVTLPLCGPGAVVPTVLRTGQGAAALADRRRA